MHDPLSYEALEGLDAVDAERVARDAFESDPAIRAEFRTADVAVSYAKAAARGLVRICGKGGE